MEQQTGSKLGKEYVKAIYCHLAYLTYMQSFILMQNAGLDEAQTRIKIVGKNISNLRYADDTTLMAESEELKSLLMKVKDESEKPGLKLNIQKTKIMPSGPITSWEIDGETVETGTDLIFLAPKSLQMVTAAMKLKNTLAPWKKSHDQPRQYIRKQRHYLPTKVCLVKAVVFPVVMYGCESWTIKKADCQKIDAFELCWRQLLRVPWIARRSNQSILKEISPEYSLEGLMP